MNKLFSKIGVAIVGMAMAIGVGVAAGLNRDVRIASATPVTGNWNVSLTAAPAGVTDETDSNITLNGMAWTVNIKKSGTNSSRWQLSSGSTYGDSTLTTTNYGDSVSSISIGWYTNSKKYVTWTVSVGTESLDSRVGNGSGAGSGTEEFDFSATKPSGTIVLSATDATGGYGITSLRIVSGNVAIVYATDIAINENVSSINYGQSTNLTTTLTPASPTNSDVSWQSSDPNVLRVNSSGAVTAVGEGSATITANADGAQTPNSVQDSLLITSSIENTYDHCDVINASLIPEATTSSYVAWNSTKTASNSSHSDSVYNGKTAYQTADKGIALNQTSGNGIIVSTSGGIAKKVAVVWANGTTTGRILNIHGSNSAVSLGSMGSVTETIVKGTSTYAVLNGGSGYRYLAINANDALYLVSLIIYWDDIDEPSIDLSGSEEAVLGDSVEFVATRSNSSAVIDWYVDDVKQNSGIVAAGDTSTFTFAADEVDVFEIKAKLNGIEVSSSIDLSVIHKRSFELVDSLEDLYDGVEIMLVGTKDEKLYAAKNYEGGSNLVAAEARVEDNKIIKTSAVGTFILNSTNDGYTIKDGSNYLSATGGTENNYLKAVALGENSYWNIDFSASNLINNINVAAESNTFRGVMRFNSGSTLFNCYASANQSDISIYRLVESSAADAFAKYFITAGGLADNNTCAETIEAWEFYEDEFDALSAGEKALYANATHNAPETYTNVNLFTVEHAVARYDHAIRTHVELRTSEFMGRFGQGKINGELSVSGGISQEFVREGSNALLIIVAISTVSLTAVGGYFFIRRRKQD